jgi:putative ABC transport system permease protein
MIKNFILVAFRNMKRQLLYTTLNIFGLAIGLACTLVIFMFVYGEWSHDRHFNSADRIYRVGVSFFNMGRFAIGPELLGDVLSRESDAVERVTRFRRSTDEKIWVNDRLSREEVYYADSNFFNVFSYAFTKGHPRVLDRKQSAVLTESMSKKLFGTTNTVGSMLLVGKDKLPYEVTGIVTDSNLPSHLRSEIWLSLDLSSESSPYWSSASIYSYVLMKPGFDETDLRASLDRIIAKHVYPQSGMEQKNVSLEKYLEDPNAVKFNILPLREIYLTSTEMMELSPVGNRSQLIIFGIIGGVILLLATVNFVNLATARATKRAREIGIRKSLGTTRVALVLQFLIESVVIAVFAMVVALGFSELFGFVFFWIGGQQLKFSLTSGGTSALVLLVIAVGVGILAGLYPAVRMTAFNPTRVLKGILDKDGRPFLRNGLIILQFAISITLIVCTLLISQQLNFMKVKDLGFRPDHVIVLDNLYLMGEEAALSMKSEILSLAGVNAASLHRGEPGNPSVISTYSFKTATMENPTSVATYFADADFATVMGFRTIEGRFLDSGRASDSSAVVLNEAAVKLLNLTGQAVGAKLNDNMTVIGVVADFHWESMHREIAPVAIMLEQGFIKGNPYSQMAIQVDPTSAQGVMATIQKTWKSRVNEEPLAWHYADDNFVKLREKEEVLTKAVSFFTVLAIIISCLGLFGLSAFTTEQRTKEMGIRKVMGATAMQIFALISSQFLTLIAISIFISIPVSWYVMNTWLTSYAYHIEPGAFVFAVAGVSGVVICLATVAYHSARTARVNPTDTLKYE